MALGNGARLLTDQLCKGRGRMLNLESTKLLETSLFALFKHNLGTSTSHHGENSHQIAAGSKVTTTETKQAPITTATSARSPDPVTPAPSQDLSLPEPPTTCCMSGCPNCVWIDYAEAVSAYYKDGGAKAQEAIKQISDPNVRAFVELEFKFR